MLSSPFISLNGMIDGYSNTESFGDKLLLELNNNSQFKLFDTNNTQSTKCSNCMVDGMIKGSKH